MGGFDFCCWCWVALIYTINLTVEKKLCAFTDNIVDIVYMRLDIKYTLPYEKYWSELFFLTL